MSKPCSPDEKPVEKPLALSPALGEHPLLMVCGLLVSFYRVVHGPLHLPGAGWLFRRLAPMLACLPSVRQVKGLMLKDYQHWFPQDDGMIEADYTTRHNSCGAVVAPAENTGRFGLKRTVCVRNGDASVTGREVCKT